jgi:glycosyltransferase involved in cell wall biosynthesis
MDINKATKYIIFGNALSVHLIKWIKALAPLCDVYVISSTDIHKDLYDIIDRSKCHSLHLTVNSGGGNVNILKHLFTVNKIIQKIKPDIVNAHYITSHGLLAAIIKRFFGGSYILIASAWGSDILLTPYKNAVYRNITKFILNSSDIVTSDAIVMTDKIESLSKTKVLTFTFGLEQMPEVSFNDKDYNLFFSNRILSSNYNIDTIIHHFAGIHLKNKEARLIIANEGEAKSKLMALCNELNIIDVVDFRGFLTQVEQSAIYKQAGFYYSLPTSDATSVSLLEAMAWGCIPVVSDIAANREWIENGKNGIILTTVNEPFNLEILARSKEIMEINRGIISEKAIFSNSIKIFLDEVSILNNSK